MLVLSRGPVRFVTSDNQWLVRSSNLMFRSRAKALLKPAIVSVVGSRAVLAAQLRRVARTGRPTILNLHRVDDRTASTFEALDPHLFDELLRWLTQSFTLTTFGELSDLTHRDDKPPLILSFDDGYKDFIDVVAPILDAHSVRANQNVIPRCIESYPATHCCCAGLHRQRAGDSLA